MQQLLADYLDVRNIKKTEQAAESANPVNGEQYDVNSFFTKKKLQRFVNFFSLKYIYFRNIYLLFQL